MTSDNGQTALATLSGCHPLRVTPRRARKSLRHGLRCSTIPPAFIDIRRDLNTLRRTLEDAVLEQRGCVSVTDAARIVTSIRWERHARLAGRWLVHHYDELNPDERLKFSAEEAKASTNRDRAIEALGLSERPREIMALVYGVGVTPRGNGDGADQEAGLPTGAD